MSKSIWAQVKSLSHTCPSCSHVKRMYKRPLHKSMALGLLFLIRIYKQKQDWVHVNEITAQGLKYKMNLSGGDFAKLAHWGFIIGKENKNFKKKTSGLWQPTIKGEKFVNGETKTLSHIILMENKFMGKAGKLIKFEDAIGTDFDYSELFKKVGK